MDIDKPETLHDVYTVIGHAVSFLMKSGKPVETGSILSQLRQFEAQSVDGMRKIYAEAVLMVKNEMN